MKRKQVTMLVTVSVPGDMSASDARKAVREMIQMGGEHWSYPGKDWWREGNVKPRKVRPATAK